MLLTYELLLITMTTNIYSLSGRTILMTTHHLDEADTLSDRILVMHRGHILSSGSPAYLKDQLGGGYRLTLNTDPAMQIADERDNGMIADSKYFK